MSIHNVTYRDSDQKSKPEEVLQHIGPLIQVLFQVPDGIAAKLNESKQSIPPPINGSALIDTGASKSCVDEKILLNLGMPTLNVATVRTPTGEDNQYIYPIKFEFSGSGLPSIQLTVLGAKLSRQNVNALIGRDLLKFFILIYNGVSGSFTLAV